MKIKLDENLPCDLAAVLTGLGHEVSTVTQEGLSGCLDAELWNAVQREARFLITQDLDFSDARLFAPATHCGVLLIRLQEPSLQNLLERIRLIFQTEDVEAWAGCFVVASERKIRVRRAPQSGLA